MNKLESTIYNLVRKKSSLKAVRAEYVSRHI